MKKWANEMEHNEKKFLTKNQRRKNRERQKNIVVLDKQIQGTYGKWKAIEDIKRSFFVCSWKVKMSSGEKEINKILTETGLRFYQEVSFDLCKRFDFYIPLIDLVIEYDGGQHFSDLKVIENDKKKESLLRLLGIKCIRYNKKHNLSEQINHDLIYHPVLTNKI